MGIGQFNSRDARSRWREDVKADLRFTAYLAWLIEEKLSPTPIDDVVRHFKISLRYQQSAFLQVVRERRRIKVRAAAINQLPKPFVQTFGKTSYALLPLHIGEQCLGVVIVDNIHNHEPLDDVALDQLETVLTQVALIYENLRQRRGNSQLIKVSQAVLAQVSHQPISQTLLEICEVVQTITLATSVAIYPLLTPTGSPIPLFDIEHAAAVGLTTDINRNHLTPGAFTEQILSSGSIMVVSDIDQIKWPGNRDTSFMKREDVRAFIAVPIRDITTNDSLGLLFLSYSEPQRFENRDTKRAEAFADLAGAAIRTARVEEQMRYDRDTAEFYRQAREQELSILHEILTLALQPQVSRRKVIQALLLAAYDLLSLNNVHIGLLLRTWQQPSETSEEPVEVREQYYLNSNNEIDEWIINKLEIGVKDYALFSVKDQLISDVNQPPWNAFIDNRPEDIRRIHAPIRSEMDVLISTDRRQPIGLFNIESPLIDVFTLEHLGLMRRLATVAALALDNLQRQDNLRNVLDAAETVVSAQDVEKTLQAVLDAGRRLASGVSAMTIWYKPPGHDYLQRVAFFGLREEHPRAKLSLTDRKSSVVSVMQAGTSIFEESVTDNHFLQEPFTEEENIKSIAVFPLMIDQQSVGVIFFNYRHKHHFTNEERTLFPIIAAIAAASIRDALRVEDLTRANLRLSSIYNIHEKIGTSIDLSETIKSALMVIKDLFKDSNPYLLLYNTNNETLEFIPETIDDYSTRLSEKSSRLRLHVPSGNGIACRVARDALKLKSPIYECISDVQQDVRYSPIFEDTKSHASIALLSTETSLIGILSVESKNINSFTESDEITLLSIGRAVSIAIDRANLISETIKTMETQSVTEKELRLALEARHKIEEQNRRARAILLHRTAWVVEVAHDIKHYIGYIKNMIGLIKINPQRTDFYISEIINSINELSKIMDANKKIDSDTFSVDEWINKKISRNLENMMSKKPGIQLVKHLNCQESLVRASKIILEHVIKHLIRNSIEAIEKEGCIIIRTNNLNGNVEISIEDNGPGVPEDIVDKLFSDQISTKSADENDDRGTGLLFVQFLVERMKGTIRHRRANDACGAIFTVNLPIISD
ncbi:MAG: hypothetical protein OHK0022_12750 [Roseiflexaceae bacterium]